MSFKKIFLISIFLLVILTFSTVSASDDIQDNNLTVNDEIDEMGEVSVDNIAEEKGDVMLSQSTNPEDALGVSVSDFYVYVESSVALEDDEWDREIIKVSEFPQDGTLKIFVNDNLKYSKNILAKNNEEVAFSIDTITKLGIKKTLKDYSITIKYNTGSNEIVLKDYIFRFYDEDHPIRIFSELAIGKQSSLLAVISPSRGDYVNGQIIVTVNNKKVYDKKFSQSQKNWYVEISNKDIGNGYKLKDYSVKITYIENGKTYTLQRLVKFVKTVPDIMYPEMMSVGEKQNIILTAAKGTAGTLTIYNALGTDDGYKRGDKIGEVKVSNGYGSFSLSGLKKGTYNFIVQYLVGGYNDMKTIQVEVKENSPGYSASVKPSQIKYEEKVVLKFKSQTASGEVEIYIDNVYYKTVKFKNGYLKQSIPNLKVGKHSIQVVFSKNKAYFSNTFDVVVKKSKIKLILFKVKVKKSAKKLVLTARLKINDKYFKGKKVTFKFKGKKYVGKTNKKGVVKVTVKKNVLKKLKVGKKVKYQVTYNKLTVKKSVKIRK